MAELVRFRAAPSAAFSALQDLLVEIKRVKDQDDLDEPPEQLLEYDLQQLRRMIPGDLQANFDWPAGAELDATRLPADRPIAISPPGTFSGERWAFVRILDLVDNCDYTLQGCELTRPNEAEIRVEAHGWPFGGLNALIALVEGFGFKVVGVDEGMGFKELRRR